MISYDKFWKTMKERGITQYDLYTLDNLCSILHCDFGDIVEHIPDEDENISE